MFEGLKEVLHRIKAGIGRLISSKPKLEHDRYRYYDQLK